jgi:hypothetical protein
MGDGKVRFSLYLRVVDWTFANCTCIEQMRVKRGHAQGRRCGRWEMIKSVKGKGCGSFRQYVFLIIGVCI